MYSIDFPDTVEDMSNIRLSVVTVSFNAHDCIEKTINSVLGQDYPGLEYIIIDGGSTDGSDQIIRKYSDKLAYWCSEKDGGIYYGMNKGIEAATGDYLLFMNADDVFADGKVLTDVAEFIRNHPEADVIYGDSEQVLEYGIYPVKPSTAYIDNKMSISHQASFVRLDLLRNHPFDTKFRYAADFEQLSSLYLEGHRFEHIERTIARVEMRGGTTHRHFVDSAEEMYSIIEARGIDIRREKRKRIRHKKMVRAFRTYMPEFVTRPVFRILAKYYKVL